MLEGFFKKSNRSARSSEFEAEAAQFRNSIEAQRKLEEKDAVLRVEADAENSERKLDRDVVLELKHPVENIIEQISEDLENGSYSTIIGDDSSGRIPTIMIGKIVQKICQRNGSQAPIVRFLAGSTGLKYGNRPNEEQKKLLLANQIAKIKDTVIQSGRELGKVLIVTDTVQSGESMDTLVRAIRENGWDADVATIGIPEAMWDDDNESEKRARRFVPTKLVIGMDKVPDIYAVKELSGVIKDKTKIFAIPHPEADNERVLRGRAHAKEIAEEIFKEYENKS